MIEIPILENRFYLLYRKSTEAPAPADLIFNSHKRETLTTAKPHQIDTR